MIEATTSRLSNDHIVDQAIKTLNEAREQDAQIDTCIIHVSYLPDTDEQIPDKGFLYGETMSLIDALLSYTRNVIYALFTASRENRTIN